MKISIYPFFVLFLLLYSSGYSQEEELQITAKDSIVVSSWMVGLGYNAVDDSGNVFGGLLRVSDEWNMLPYPSRISLGRYFKSGLGLEAIGSYNQYREGKIVDNMPNTEVMDYFSVDARLTYDLNKIVGQTGWFDPYVGIGLGYTDANKLGRGTYNAAIGFRTWFNDRWGLDFSSTGKWSMGSENGASNHLQHAAGVVYQFGIEKGLSKKGEEKLELLAAIENEKQRQMDSINEVNRQNEALLLAERLEKEKAAAALAAAEDAKRKAELERKNTIEKRIADLDFVYFDLNSSALTKSSKSVLDSLAILLEEIPSLTLKVTSHTDSRGASKYNDWLSEKRVASTKAYLISKGVSDSRLTTEAYGEKQLLNECDDNTYCPEEKHKINRRSEFIIVQY